MTSLKPDGVEIEVPWGQMQVGQSVFIPCFHTFEATRQLRHIARAHGYHFRIVPRLEGGYRGLRVWRLR